MYSVGHDAIVQIGLRNLDNLNLENNKPQQESVVSNFNKRFHPSTPEYFEFNTPDMSFHNNLFLHLLCTLHMVNTRLSL